MNDVGLTLAWLAVQIAILLAPALMLHAPGVATGARSGSLGRGAEPRAGRGLERRGVRATDRVESEKKADEGAPAAGGATK